jgi:hypothetical protein
MIQQLKVNNTIGKQVTRTYINPYTYPSSDGTL